MKVVDEEMDGVAREQRKTLRTIETELADVRRRLDTIYNLVETTPVNMADFTPRIRQHRDRQERLDSLTKDLMKALRSVNSLSFRKHRTYVRQRPERTVARLEGQRKLPARPPGVRE